MRLTIGRNAALAALPLALLAGCGDGDDRTYDLAAFRLCMTDHGVQTIRAQRSNTAPSGTVFDILGRRFPEAVIAATDTGQAALIYIGPAKYTDEFQALVDVLDDDAELSRTGNFVVVRPPHTPQGFVDDMEACRDAARNP
jgi:hypothetical protein